MKSLLIILSIALSTVSVQAQNHMTKNGKISFYSKTDVEDIDAVNNQVVSVLNTSTGDLAFSVLINGFLFKKALMQEHFNENYMESNKYPKATFKGKITDLASIDLTKDGIYNAKVNGDLTMHGETNNISLPVQIQVKGGNISGSTSFSVKLDDYKINVPKVVEKNISKTIDIKVDCGYTAR